MLFIENALNDYISKLSSKEKVPGGGSAAAVSALLGAGLNRMVINFSCKKNIQDSVIDQFMVLADQQDNIIKKLKKYVDDDCAVFLDLMKAYSEGGDVAGKAEAAADVPFGICAACCESIQISSMLLRDCNRNLLSDLGCAASILKGAFEAARYNVEVNLSSIKDEKFIKRIREGLDDMGIQVEGISKEVVHYLTEKQDNE